MDDPINPLVEACGYNWSEGWERDFKPLEDWCLLPQDGHVEHRSTNRTWRMLTSPEILLLAQKEMRFPYAWQAITQNGVYLWP